MALLINWQEYHGASLQIDVSRTGLTEPGLKKFEGCTAIKTFDASNNRELGKAGLKSFDPDWSELDRLKLDDTYLEDTPAEELRTRLRAKSENAEVTNRKVYTQESSPCGRGCGVYVRE